MKSSAGKAIVISVTRATIVSTQPRREDRDLERDLGPVEEAEELVAAEGAVGPKQQEDPFPRVKRVVDP
jgi:hypothetical protein